MSVRSSADEAIANAKSKVDEAIEQLAEVVIRQCQGTEDLTPDARAELRQAFSDLIEARDKLEEY